MKQKFTIVYSNSTSPSVSTEILRKIAERTYTFMTNLLRIVDGQKFEFNISAVSCSLVFMSACWFHVITYITVLRP